MKHQSLEESCFQGRFHPESMEQLRGMEDPKEKAEGFWKIQQTKLHSVLPAMCVPVVEGREGAAVQAMALPAMNLQSIWVNFWNPANPFMIGISVKFLKTLHTFFQHTWVCLTPLLPTSTVRWDPPVVKYNGFYLECVWFKFCTQTLSLELHFLLFLPFWFRSVSSLWFLSWIKCWIPLLSTLCCSKIQRHLGKARTHGSS